MSAPAVDVGRADEIDRTSVAWRVFRTSPSGRVLLPASLVLVICRLTVGAWSRGDVAVLVAIVVLTGPLEWFVHRHLLHADPDAWSSRRLGIGSGHRRHHVDPPDLRWLLLPGADAAIFLAVLSVFGVVWSSLLALAVVGAVWPSVLTALTLTALALTHYEWVHLLVHTAHRPRTRRYARLARNHRWHHYRNEDHWLGVTSNLGDRLLGTYHTTAGAVPPSGTARTLGRTDD